jgi:uncharacterized protein (DUF305 family)
MKPYRLAVIFSLMAFFLLFAAGCDNITTPEPGEENRSATQTAGAKTGYPSSPTEVILPQTGPGFDQLFIDMLVPYQQGSVIMSQQVQASAEHQELKDFAANEIKTEQARTDRLLDLRQQWFGSRQTPGLDQRSQLLDIAVMDLPSGAQPTDPQKMIDNLRRTEGAPDLAYIDTMIAHHQVLQAVAQMALTRGQHPETKQIAQELIDTYGREIEQLTTWRPQWSNGAAPQTTAPIPPQTTPVPQQTP